MAPALSLGAAITAAMLADVLWAIFTIAGVEHAGVVPGARFNRLIGYDIGYSHSLAMDTAWGAVLAAAYFTWRRHTRAAWVLGAAVVSHWVLDVVSHRPDMPLAPGLHIVFGLGLWNSMGATVVVEGGLWAAALLLYARATKAGTRAGAYGFWPAIVVLTFMSLINLFAPPPPDPIRGGFASLVFFTVIIGWAYWMERARLNRPVEAKRRGWLGCGAFPQSRNRLQPPPR